jgi:hypothetical protein
MNCIMNCSGEISTVVSTTYKLKRKIVEEVKLTGLVLYTKLIGIV